MADIPAIDLVPKTGGSLERWLVESMAGYEQARIAAGDTPEQAAAAKRSSLERFFPDGVPMQEHRIFTVVRGGDDVGWLWLGPWTPGDRSWWVLEVQVHEPFRRQGIGRAIMRAAEEVAAAAGADSLELNVFANNTGALALYTELGYFTTSLHMRKELGG